MLFLPGSCTRDRRQYAACRTDVECANGAECIMGITGQGSCQIRTDSATQRAKEWSQHMYAESKGGLGKTWLDAPCMIVGFTWLTADQFITVSVINLCHCMLSNSN